jgi:alpha-beta hydrolase superfamily lysophospholipase
MSLPFQGWLERDRTMNNPAGQGATPKRVTTGSHQMRTITTNDGTQIYYKDWGTGQPVVFSHGWPLTADAWEDQMMFLASRRYRCIAHDRRGHGRSSRCPPPAYGGSGGQSAWKGRTTCADLVRWITRLAVALRIRFERSSSLTARARLSAPAIEANATIASS